MPDDDSCILLLFEPRFESFVVVESFAEIVVGEVLTFNEHDAKEKDRLNLFLTLS